MIILYILFDKLKQKFLKIYQKLYDNYEKLSEYKLIYVYYTIYILA